MTKENQIARLVSKIRFTKTCWLWLGTPDTEGYGHFCGEYVHRWLYRMVNSPVPRCLTLDHLCRKRNCVNPDHLEPVTLKENILRGSGPPALNSRLTSCNKGHEFDRENTLNYTRKGKMYRVCRKCTNMRNMAWRSRNPNYHKEYRESHEA